MRYWLEVYDPLSTNRLRIVSNFRSLQIVRTENAVGALVVSLPLKEYKAYEWKLNQVIEVWREKGGNTALQNETAYFVQDWQIYRDRSGEVLVDIYAADANWILSTRVVDYYAGSSQADKSGKADDIAKAIVRENFLSLAVAERRIPRLACDVNVGAGPQITKSFSRRNVLTVLQEIAETSLENSVYLVFDVVRTVPCEFEFRTYVGMRGVDHSRDSSDPRFVGEIYGNLEDAFLRYEYFDECTVAIAGGQGEGADRLIKYAKDLSRISNGSPYNYRERFVDARQDETEAAVQAEADAELYRGRPKRIISGKLIDTLATSYGVNYGFGDIVTVEAFGQTVDCHVASVQISVDSKGGERVEVALRSEDAAG